MKRWRASSLIPRFVHLRGSHHHNYPYHYRPFLVGGQLTDVISPTSTTSNNHCPTAATTPTQPAIQEPLYRTVARLEAVLVGPASDDDADTSDSGSEGDGEGEGESEGDGFDIHTVSDLTDAGFTHTGE